MMPDKRIVIDIGEDGRIAAETFDMEGTECLEELDRLLKDLALETSVTKKEEYFKNGVASTNTVTVKKR